MPVCHSIQPVLFPGSASPSHWSPQEAKTAPALLTAMIWCPAQGLVHGLPPGCKALLQRPREPLSPPTSVNLFPIPFSIFTPSCPMGVFGHLSVPEICPSRCPLPSRSSQVPQLGIRTGPAHVQPQPRWASGLCPAFVFSVCYLPNLATWQSAPLPQRPKHRLPGRLCQAGASPLCARVCSSYIRVLLSL